MSDDEWNLSPREKRKKRYLESKYKRKGKLSETEAEWLWSGF